MPLVTPKGLGHNKLTTRHTYSKEDCGHDHDDPSMSPGSRSGRGAMTLTPAPNGAKKFYIAHSASESDASPKRWRAGLSWPEETYSFFRKEESNTVPKLQRTGVRPLCQRAHSSFSVFPGFYRSINCQLSISRKSLPICDIVRTLLA